MLRKLMDDYPLSVSSWPPSTRAVSWCSRAESAASSSCSCSSSASGATRDRRSSALQCARSRASCATATPASSPSDPHQQLRTTRSYCRAEAEAERRQLCARLEPLVSYAAHLHDVYWAPRETRDLSALPALVAHLLRVLDAALPALDERSAAALLHLCATRLLARPAATAEATSSRPRPVEQLGLFHQRAAALHLLAHCFLPAYSKLRASLPSVQSINIIVHIYDKCTR